MRTAVLIILMAGFIILQALIGGTRPVYAIPGAMIFGLAALAVLKPRLISAQKAAPACIFSMFVFLGYVLVRNRLSLVDHIGLVQFYAASSGLLVYLATTLVLIRSAERRRLVFLLLLLAVIQTGVGVVQFGGGKAWMPIDFLQRADDSWRASGLFISPNHFAGFVEIAALFAFSLLVWGKGGAVRRIVLGYVGIMCLAGVAISGSRGGYLSTATGLLTLLCLTLWAIRKTRPERFASMLFVSVGAITVLVSVAVFLMLAHPELSNRLNNTFETKNMRILMWKSSLQQFQLAPVAGTGAATFLYYGRKFRDPSVQNDPIHVHNDYLQLLAEYGIIGAALFLAVYFLHLRSGLRGLGRIVRSNALYYEPRDDGLALCIGALSALAAYTVHSVVDFNMQIPANTALMAFVLGILSAPALRGKNAATSPGFERVMHLALPLLGLGAIVYCGMMFPGEWCSDHARRALRDKRLQEALDWAEKGIARSKKDPDLFYYAGEASRTLAAFDKEHATALFKKSIGYFKDGLDVFPQDSRLIFKLAHAQSDAGDYAAATTTLDTAEEWDPKSAYLPAYHGVVEQGSEYYDQALEYYEQALQIGWENEVALEGRDIVKKIIKARDDAQAAAKAAQEKTAVQTPPVPQPQPAQVPATTRTTAATPSPSPTPEPGPQPGEPRPYKPVKSLEEL
jgi:O-antigen ligase